MNNLFTLASVLLCVFLFALLLHHRSRQARHKRGRILSDCLHQARRRESDFMNRQVLEEYWEGYLKEQMHDTQDKTQLTALVWFCRDYPDYQERGYQLALRCVIKEDRDADWVRVAQILGKLYYGTNDATDRQVFNELQLQEDLRKRICDDARSQ